MLSMEIENNYTDGHKWGKWVTDPQEYPEKGHLINT